MKLLLLLVALFSVQAFGVTAALVTTTGSEDARGENGTGGTSVINVPYAEPVIVGNCAGVAFKYSTTNNPTPSVTDDQDNAYYEVAQNPLDSANGIKMEVWITPPVSAAVHHAVVDFNVPNTIDMQFITFTVSNCGSTSDAIVDGSASNVSAGTAVTAGSLTPENSGDLLLQFAFIDSNLTAPALTSATLFSQPDITWALRHAELVDGELMQYGTYNSASAINPEMTIAPSSAFISIAIAIKGAEGGRTCSGICVNSIQHIQLCYGGDCQDSDPASPQPAITQFPMIGNLLIAVMGGGCDLTSIEYGPTLMNKRATYTGTGASETEQVFDLLNNTPNNKNQFTITQDSSGCTGQNGYAYSWTVLLYDVSAPVEAWSFSSTTTASGQVNNCSSPCSLAGASITPAGPGILFADITEWYNEVNGIASPWTSDTIWPGIVYQYPNLDENNGWAHYENSGTSSESTTWTFLETSGYPQGYWASIAAAYEYQASDGLGPTNKGAVRKGAMVHR